MVGREGLREEVSPVCPQKRLDPDPVCPERLDPDPDPVNIRPDPQPWPPPPPFMHHVIIG